MKPTSGQWRSQGGHSSMTAIASPAQYTGVSQGMSYKLPAVRLTCKTTTRHADHTIPAQPPPWSTPAPSTWAWRRREACQKTPGTPAATGVWCIRLLCPFCVEGNNSENRVSSPCDKSINWRLRCQPGFSLHAQLVILDKISFFRRSGLNQPFTIPLGPEGVKHNHGRFPASGTPLMTRSAWTPLWCKLFSGTKVSHVTCWSADRRG